VVQDDSARAALRAKPCLRYRPCKDPDRRTEPATEGLQTLRPCSHRQVEKPSKFAEVACLG
jgi:hypothetical protein